MPDANGSHVGLEDALNFPLFEAIANRRSRRISKGIRSVPAGGLSYTSKHEPEPLTELEEAFLIAATGITGVAMPDMPFKDEKGGDLLGTPMLELLGRAASSPDNAQGTHFFMMNDSGTYFLRRPEGVASPVLAPGEIDARVLIGYAESCKVQVLDKRLDFPRVFPCYLGRNRYVSNLPGTTILVPVVDLTRQYINGMMYLLSQEEGRRPMVIDDWNLYRKAGVSRWVRSGYLNKELPLPLGLTGTFRIHIEADLLVQNLLLVIQAMRLGGWVHAAFPGPLLLGDPEYARFGPGLGFRYEKPKNWMRRNVLRFMTPLPAWRDNPVGLDGVLEGTCPPYQPDMNAAVDAIIAQKYGESGVYGQPAPLNQVFRPGMAERFLEEAPRLTPEAIECTKDVCNYIYDTYGRFPAHVDAMYVPGVWVQIHHLDLDYYAQLYDEDYTKVQAEHDRIWHSA